MTAINLTVQTREETGKKVQQLRAQGKLPAVVYGHGSEPQNVLVDQSQFAKIYEKAGESTLIDLNIDKQDPIKVLIQDTQRDPKTHEFLHVDFHQVRMDEKIRTDVVLKFIGEPPAVKEFSGILVTNIDALPIECLPNDLVHEIEVNLSTLKTFDDVIRVVDLKLPEGIISLAPKDEVIALVQEPRTEKEVEEAAGEAPTEGEEAAGEAPTEGEEAAGGATIPETQEK